MYLRPLIVLIPLSAGVSRRTFAADWDQFRQYRDPAPRVARVRLRLSFGAAFSSSRHSSIAVFGLAPASSRGGADALSLPPGPPHQSMR